jgi:hypothetical protein
MFTKPKTEWTRFLLVAAVVGFFIWLFLGSMEKAEGFTVPRVGIQYTQSSDTKVNTFIDDVNKALDTAMRDGCSDNIRMGIAINEASSRLPKTCTKAFEGLPPGTANLVNVIRPHMCNKDDTVNRAGFVNFLTRLGSNMCTKYR